MSNAESKFVSQEFKKSVIETRWVDGPFVTFEYPNPKEFIRWNGSHTFTAGYYHNNEWQEVDAAQWFPDSGDNISFEQAKKFANEWYEEICGKIFDDNKGVKVR